MRRATVVGRTLTMGMLVAVLGGIVAPASSQQPPTRTTLQLFEGYEGSFFKEVDVAPRRPWGGAGDYSVGIQRLYNPETCDRVGKNLGRFTIVRKLKQDNAWYIFDSTLGLQTGKITLYGAARYSDFFAEGGATATVTGGVGDYTDVQGTVAITPARLCGERGSMYTISFRP